MVVFSICFFKFECFVAIILYIWSHKLLFLFLFHSPDPLFLWIGIVSHKFVCYIWIFYIIFDFMNINSIAVSTQQSWPESHGCAERWQAFWRWGTRDETKVRRGSNTCTCFSLICWCNFGSFCHVWATVLNTVHKLSPAPVIQCIYVIIWVQHCLQIINQLFICRYSLQKLHGNRPDYLCEIKS